MAIVLVVLTFLVSIISRTGGGILGAVAIGAEVVYLVQLNSPEVLNAEACPRSFVVQCGFGTTPHVYQPHLALFMGGVFVIVTLAAFMFGGMLGTRQRRPVPL